MSEFRVTLRPALAGLVPIQRNGLIIEALPEGAVLHLLAHPSSGEPAGLVEAVATVGLSLRFVSRAQWFAVGSDCISPADLKLLKGRLKPQVEIVDQSHGRVRMTVRGKFAVRMLAKGTAVNLDLAEFPVGRSATTLIGHISAHVSRTGEDAFEIIALRGFAESLWDDLARMSLEFS